MRIAIFHNLPSGGAKRHTYEQVKELKRRGHYLEEFALSTANLEFMSLRPYVEDVHVFELKWKPLRHYRVPAVGPYLHLIQNYVNLQNLRQVSRRVAHSIDGAGFDVVLVKDCMFTIAPFVLHYLKTPAVFYAHTTLYVTSVERLRSLKPTIHGFRRLIRLISWPATSAHEALVRAYYVENMRCAKLVVTNSRSAQRLIKQQCNVDARIVHPGIDTTIFHPAPKRGDNYVLSVGAINVAKGHRLVIEALSKLPAEVRPALIIAGIEGEPNEPEYLTDLAATLDVKLTFRSVHVTSEMAELYAQARALVIGHIFEYLGNNALEAMACGTPVVAVDPCGLVENAVDGVTGFLVKERTAEALAQGLMQLLQDPVQAERLGQQAREYVLSYWTWPRAVDDLEAQFAAALETRQGP